MMAAKEFAAVTPGEMIKQKFLAEYGLSQKSAREGIWDFGKPDRRHHCQSSTQHR
jgi:hypothetical protein